MKVKKVSKKTRAAPTAAVQPAKQYNTYLDVLRGFAIILVVLGHSIESFAANGNYDGNLLFRIIYSFHMPLFMLVSGAAAAYSSRPMNFDFLKRKFYQLVIPYISWGVLSYYLNGNYHHLTFITHLKTIIVSPDYGLWFLWVLFLNFCLLALMKYLTKWLRSASYFLVWLAIYALPLGKYGVGLVKWHLPFFVVGYLIFVHRERLVRFRRLALGFCIIAFPLLVASWHRLYYPSFVLQLNGHLVARHWSVVTLGEVANINVYSVASLAYIYLVPFAGIGFVYWLLRLKPARYLYGFFSMLGLYTLDVYVSHTYFLRFAFGHSWLQIGSGAVIGLGLSLALGIVILRRFDWLNRIFLGGRTATGRKVAPVK